MASSHHFTPPRYVICFLQKCNTFVLLLLKYSHCILSSSILRFYYSYIYTYIYLYIVYHKACLCPTFCYYFTTILKQSISYSSACGRQTFRETSVWCKARHEIKIGCITGPTILHGIHKNKKDVEFYSTTVSTSSRVYVTNSLKHQHLINSLRRYKHSASPR